MTRKVLIAVIIALWGGCFASLAQAADAERAFLMKGARPLGMGDAFLATRGRDENAIFYNPAAINDYEKKVHGYFLSPMADVTYKGIAFVNDVLDLIDDLDAADTSTEKNDIFGAFTQANFGRVESYRAAVPAAFVMHRYFAAGIVAESDSSVLVTDPSFDSFDLLSRNDIAVVMGTAWGWFQNSLQTGIAIKPIYRIVTRETITQRDVVVTDDFSDAVDINYGLGVGVDLGVKYNVPLDWKVTSLLKPSVGITYQDIGNTRFTGEGEDKAQSVSAGFALDPKIGPIETTFAFDVRDLNHRADFITLMHTGLELRFPEFFKTKASVRIGANQGYLSGGLTLDWRYVKLTAMTYGEEEGKVSRVEENRRFGGQVAFGF